MLYLSRYIVQNKADYYRLLQAVRDADAWEDWVLYILTAGEQTARASIESVRQIRTLLLDMKHRMREQHHFYSQDLLNNLFRHPYTKIDFLMRDLGVTRQTAARYLDQLADSGFLRKQKQGRANYYVNLPLCQILERTGIDPATFPESSPPPFPQS